MSFDLYFCGRLGAQLEINRVRAYMRDLNFVEELRSDAASA
jgi:hypothetical protein